MSRPQPKHQIPHINPAAILPADWNRDHDILLIVGEQAAAIAQPFSRYGCRRVMVMFPNGVPVEPAPADVVSVRNRQELGDAIMLYPGEHPRKFAMIRTPQCSVSTTVTNDINQVLAHSVSMRRANQLVVQDLSPLWAKNGLQNLPHVAAHPLVNDIGDALAGIPMIVVGAGPSLANNIDLLRKAKGRAIIVCVNRALRSMKNAGIEPDIAINVEPQDVGCQFEGIDTQALTALVLCATSHPPLFTLNTPNILTFIGNQEADGWMLPEPVDLVPAAGSVSCSAVSLGLLWKCDPIVLVGQDLSFSGGAYYHAGGADGDTRAVFNDDTGMWQLEGHSEELRNTVKDRTRDGVIRFQATQVPGFYGGTVDTSLDFANFRMWFQQTAHDHPATAFFNCTEGGVHIEGMHHTRLLDVIETLEPLDVELNAIFNSAEVQSKVARRERVMQKRGRNIRSGIQRAVRQAQHCVALIDEAARNPRALQRLSKAETELKKTTRRMTVLALMNQKTIHEVMERAQSAKTMEESLAASRALYQFIVEDGRRLLE